MKKKKYKILTPNGIIFSEKKGKYGGYKPHKIFGTLQCASGKRMKKENRVFFFSIGDAIKCGYRPCKLCKPL